MTVEELHKALEAFLATRVGAQAKVSGLSRMAGGASRAIYAFDADIAGQAPCALVLRMDITQSALQAHTCDEFALLALVQEVGVTVPRVYWDGDESAGLGGKFFIMDRVEGEAIARKLLRDDEYARTRERLPDDLARELARIHGVSVEDERIAFLEPLSTAGPADEVARYLASLDAVSNGHPHPVLRYVARWLVRNAPEAGVRSLVHGDFRIGNILFDSNGLAAVLDWELAHFGDPMEDLGWLCVRAWRFGADHRPVGGLCDRERLFEAYEREGGGKVDPDRVRYWEILGNWKWAVICAMQAARCEDGAYPDIELAAIGRRIADSEWEALALLEEEVLRAR